MRLAIPAQIVQRYFPESEIVWDYSRESYVLETRDGYTIPTFELYADVDENTDQLWTWEDEWLEVQ